MKTPSNHCLPQAGQRVLVPKDVVITVRVAVWVTTKVAECVLSPHLCRPPCFEALNPSFFTHPFLVPPRLLPPEILHGRLCAPSLFLEVTYLFHCRYSRSFGRHQRRSPCRTSCSRGCERRPSNAKSDERPWRSCRSVKRGLSRKQK